MIVDTSVFVAIILNEPISQKLFEVLDKQTRLIVPATVLLEATMVLKNRKTIKHVHKFEELLDLLNVEFSAFSPEMANIAQTAFLKYGKGQGHPAQLNFGDCMVYSVAKAEDMPLLYVGDDFTKTDVRATTDL